MAKLPAIPYIIEQLRKHQSKAALNTAQLVYLLNAFGGNWNATHVEDLLAGRVKPTSVETAFLKRYLLSRFYAYNIS